MIISDFNVRNARIYRGPLDNDHITIQWITADGKTSELALFGDNVKVLVGERCRLKVPHGTSIWPTADLVRTD